MSETVSGRARAAGDGHAALDTLRFAAALFIVLFHYGASAPTPLRDFAPLFGEGWIATDFFLMLSGYVLGRAYGRALDERRLQPLDFVRRRVLRVWPAHLVVLVGFAAVLALAAWAGVAAHHPDAYGAREFWLQAAMLHGLAPGDWDGWNTPTWTLSALLVCYLLFPLLWRSSRPLHGQAGAALAAAALLVTAAVLSLLVFGRSMVDLDWGLLRALPLFGVGVLLARLAPALPLRGRLAPLTAGLALAGVLVLQLQPRSPLSDLQTLAAEAALILAADAWAVTGFRLAAWLGAVSFSLFLVHEPVSALWFHAVGAEVGLLGLSRPVQWALWAVSPLVAIAVAATFHAAIDAPLQRLWRRPSGAPACPVPAESALSAATEPY